MPRLSFQWKNHALRSQVGDKLFAHYITEEAKELMVSEYFLGR